MTLPSTGSLAASQINVELRRAETAPFSLDGALERFLSQRTTGQIAFSDFRGKTYELIRNLPAGGVDTTLQSLYTAEEWASNTDKRVVLPAGTERGSSVVHQSAVHIGGTGWGGSLTFDVYGVISGAGGGANSGEGGMALNTNRTGLSGQKATVRIFPGGVIRGGGGGGGRGGNGGGGYYTSTQDDHPNNINHARFEYGMNWCGARWEGLLNFQVRPGTSGWNWRDAGGYLVLDNWWHDGNNQIFVGASPYGPNRNNEGTVTDATHYLWRRITHHHYTNGGAGGNGGRGQGYGQSAAGGSGGGAPGTNAGWGGTGGNGGGYGAWGATGNTGGGGNNGGGAGGSGGGAPGFSIANIGNANVLNSGTLQGRT